MAVVKHVDPLLLQIGLVGHNLEHLGVVKQTVRVVALALDALGLGFSAFDLRDGLCEHSANLFTAEKVCVFC